MLYHLFKLISSRNLHGRLRRSRLKVYSILYVYLDYHLLLFIASGSTSKKGRFKRKERKGGRRSQERKDVQLSATFARQPSRPLRLNLPSLFLLLGSGLSFQFLQ